MSIKADRWIRQMAENHGMISWMGKRLVERGYTEKQVRLLSEWYLRVRKSQ